MSDASGGAGEGPSSKAMSDQLALRIGQQIADVLAAAGLTPPAGQRRAVPPDELGRLVHAYTAIEDSRVRGECVSLLEAIGGSTAR